MAFAINLLPWREKKRLELRRQFFIKLVACFFISAMIILLAYQYQHGKLNDQIERNNILLSEISILDKALDEFSKKKLARDTLQRRLELVNALQKQRNNNTILFNLLPELMPDGLMLDSVSMQAGKVQIEGRSYSNAQVANLLDRLEKHEAAFNVQMHSIITQNDSSDLITNKFTATFELAKYVVADLPKDKKNGS